MVIKDTHEYLGQIIKGLVRSIWDIINVFSEFDIRETSPYPFGNFRKLSLYNCFMPI